MIKYFEVKKNFEKNKNDWLFKYNIDNMYWYLFWPVIEIFFVYQLKMVSKQSFL